MEEIRLTKDADALICVLYKEYLERRRSGTPREHAKYFGSSKSIHENLMSKWSFEDVDKTCRELAEANLLECFCADNTVSESVVSDLGISYMENRFGRKFYDILSCLERIRSLLPW